MSEDGGAFYPSEQTMNPDGLWNQTLERGASLRERFAVAIAGNPHALERAFSAAKDAMADLRTGPDNAKQLALISAVVSDLAQALTDEAMKRRKEDTEALQQLQCDEMVRQNDRKRLQEGAEAMEGEYPNDGGLPI